jgi:FkbM family methyltransferase
LELLALTGSVLPPCGGGSIGNKNMDRGLTSLLSRLPLFRPAPKLDHRDTRIFERLQPGDLAIDCGANVGLVTERMAARGAIVHAFEPNPYAYAELTRRFAGNPSVLCHPQGVWHANSTLKLFLHENAAADQVAWSTGSSLLSFKNNVSAESFHEVQVIDLLEFINALARPVRLLKIDVEGAECEILEAFIARRFHEKVELTLVETHERKIPQLRERTEAIRRSIRALGIHNINLDWV